MMRLFVAFSRQSVGVSLLLVAISLLSIEAEICRVHPLGLLLGNDTDITGDAEVYECHVMTSDGESEDYILIDSFADDVLQEQAMWKGEWYIEYERDWLVTRHPSLPLELDDPQNKPIQTLTLDQVWDRLAPTRARRRLLQQGHWKRRLGERTVTDRNRGKMILVRVTTADAEPRTDVEQIYDAFFGSDSFQTQMKACSFGQMDMVPYDEDEPVLEVSVPLPAADYGYQSLFSVAEVFVRDYYGVESSHELAEFVAMAAPRGLRGPGSGGAVAAAGYDSWKSVFTDIWAGTPMVTLHELGHNLNVGHAWKDGNAYGDRSSVMGGVFLNVVHNCYNGLAYDHLGWMDDKVVEIDHTTDGPHSVDLAFFGEYDIALRRHVTVVKTAGYYIYYNLHRGINADSVTEEDRVLLHRYRQEGAIAAGSEYSTYLHEEARPSFSNETLDFAVRVCRTVTGRPNGDRPFPGSVTLEIGTLDQEDSLCQEETTEPAPRPTRPPTPQPTAPPTEMPVSKTTPQPTRTPTPEPSPRPTRKPTRQPTARPTQGPLSDPTSQPTVEPTRKPTRRPTPQPTRRPTPQPSPQPTSPPAFEPTPNPTRRPTPEPTLDPTTSLETTLTPTSEPTSLPTSEPTVEPTPLPTSEPTVEPTSEPTLLPTRLVSTSVPTLRVVPAAELTPSPAPTSSLPPTGRPTPTLTPEPTFPEPTPLPTFGPSANPSDTPSDMPTFAPTQASSVLTARRGTSTNVPTAIPTSTPSAVKDPVIAVGAEDLVSSARLFCRGAAVVALPAAVALWNLL